MKKIFLVSFTLLSQITFCQVGEWTWMHGDNIPNPTPSYGTQGVTAPSNKSPGRYEAAEWTDLQGNFWMFGGNGVTGRYNDLWKFNPSTNQWTWMKGSNLIDQAGICGTQSVSAPTNNPGARGFGSGTWVDTSGDLWLFGGSGYDCSGNNGKLNDLWKYNISTNEWTWMKGSSSRNSAGYYGVLLVTNILNNPKSRHETSVTWTDKNGNLWLFGGNDNIGFANNDLWKYNVSTNQWTWMHGDSIPDQSGIYGTMGVPNPTNTPGARWSFAKWQVQSNKFYLFGGQGKDASGVSGNLNDLWFYNPSTNEWTWINGTSTANPLGSIDSICVSSSNNLPSGRMENRATWKDTCNNFIMFGGFNSNGFYNDLWSYNILLDKWTWISGDSLPNQSGVYGTIMVSSPLNKPCSRWGSIGWKDQLGNFWMFGGNLNGTLYYNDMWKFHSYTPCMTCQTVGLNDIISNDQIKIYPNPFSTQTTLQTDNFFHNAILTVYNSFGQTVKQIKNISGRAVILSRDNLPSGLYFVRLTEENKTIAVDKLVITDK